MLISLIQPLSLGGGGRGWGFGGGRKYEKLRSFRTITYPSGNQGDFFEVTFAFHLFFAILPSRFTAISFKNMLDGNTSTFLTLYYENKKSRKFIHKGRYMRVYISRTHRRHHHPRYTGDDSFHKSLRISEFCERCFSSIGLEQHDTRTWDIPHTQWSCPTSWSTNWRRTPHSHSFRWSSHRFSMSRRREYSFCHQDE